MTTERNAAKPPAYTGHGGTFKNTLAERDTPDPSVVYQNGYYYMTFTHNGADIVVMKSRTLDFREAESRTVWYPPAETLYSANLWAPEIQFLRESWYIYFAADNGQNENHRMYALKADTADPMGSYTFQGQIADTTNKWAIDGLVLEHNEQLYFVWSGWEGDVNAAQNTYIAPMSDPLTISGPRVLISKPDLEWERAGGPPYINEGHSVLRRNGRIFIVYSGAGSWTPFYSLGLLALREGGDPLKPEDWTKSKKPLLTMNEAGGVYGPGHNTFAPSPDGTEQWLIYHATPGENDGWNNRKARAQRIEWDKDGLPVFGEALPLAEAINVPSGSGIFKADTAIRNGDVLAFPLLPSAAPGVKPVLLHYRLNRTAAESARIWTGLDKSGAREMQRAAGHSAEPGGGAADSGEEAGTEIALTPNEDGYVYVEAPFQTGMNTLYIRLEGSGAELDAIEIPRYEAELAALEAGAEREDHPFASGGGTAVLSAGQGVVRFLNVRVPQEGEYGLAAVLFNPEGPDTELFLSANGGKAVRARIEGDVAPARNVPVRAEGRLKLKAGANTIEVTAAGGSLTLDCLDLVSGPPA
ncbi:family 43 glycosylhydrolase [Paenibacillus spiritus]|uniref:Family 43 glycosylhydrolase n=2 Tax=Paenibacillus spiritus TaxID=2496557 RepID=A0A5J5G935_9BACL|nr:family 43 glycosylhydrolase [Paenibacillus spiritus]